MIVSPNKPLRVVRRLCAIERLLASYGLPITREGAMQLRCVDMRLALPRSGKFVVQWANVKGYRYSVQLRGAGVYNLPLLCKDVNEVALWIGKTLV